MNSNEKLISTFYCSFQKRDYHTMQECYADDAVFSDEVFKDLNACQLRGMWEMLICRARDLQLDFTNVKANEFTGSAEWIATYTFSVTNRKVRNHVYSRFTFENGKIIRHIDHFHFYKWLRQAFGPTGILLGWTDVFQEKIREGAMKNLDNFMQSRRLVH